MAKISPSTSKKGFFPSSKSSRAKLDPKIQRTSQALLKRNDSERRDELDQRTKQDVKVDIPESIKEFSRIKKVVDAIPENQNESKIARLKHQIKNGKYQFDFDAMAEKILTEEF
jgi:negative regulator of flagellin synthesis FlgM